MSYDINLKHLEYFIKVARLGSINKAAQMLYVSQSHLGKIIHDLELTWSRQGETAVLQADFASCAFMASVRDAGGERFRLQQ